MGGLWENLSLGFGVAFSVSNLLFCFIGVLIGTITGVLPGIGPVGAISLLFPLTYGMHPVTSIIMLAGIYYGAQYGGSTTSILVNIPGEASSVVTCLDGYQMAKQGRAGPALGIAAFGSFIAGTIGIIFVMVLAFPLSEMGVKFGPPEYFSLATLALSIVIYLAQGPTLKAMIMAVLGVALSQVGMDIMTSKAKFTFGIPALLEGIGLVPLAMGLFGIGEVLSNFEQPEGIKIYEEKIESILPTLRDWKESIGAILRGTFLGFPLGVIPGGGAVIASFVSYAVEKRVSKHPEKFGTGAIEGVAGPESANNAGSTGSFIPLFTLGIPSNAVTALLLGGLIIHGMSPGPLLIKRNPELFWGTIASMYIGNVMLLILNLPLIGLWVKLLKVPYRILYPFILFFCVIGAYSINYSSFDVMLMFIFGGVGYLFRKFQYEPAPLIMAFIMGSMLENSLRQSLAMSTGDLSIFITRPISVTCLAIALFLLISPVFFKKRVQASH